MSYIKTYDQQVYEIQVKGHRNSELDAAGVQSGTSNMADLDRLYDMINLKAGRLDILG